MRISIFNDTPTDYRILFLDMDAFFAKCEQQINPSLRGRPIAVTPQLVDSGCAIACSTEAKARGVKTGMPIFEARRTCPDLILVEAHPTLYKQFHYKIRNTLEQFSPWVEAKSIDEFSMRLSLSEQDHFSAMTIARSIKDVLRDAIGSFTTATIGFGPNYFLAKMAAETHKPDGIAAITIERAKDALSPLDLTDLCGIAGGLSRRLGSDGIFTVPELYQTDQPTLRRLFGFNGVLWWYRLRGYEVDDVVFTRSQIGHSHVLAPEWRVPHKAVHVLNRLVHKVGQRLRREGFWARHTHLTLRYADQGGFYYHSLTMPYCDSHTMMELAQRFFCLRPRANAPILQIAFSVSELIQGTSFSESLFPEMQTSLHLTRALDNINDRFGRDTIFPASMMAAKDTAPDRIPFGKVRY